MALQVIGSGLGRTGTLSLKHALERLGFGPCYHMTEVFTQADAMPLWVDAAEGRPDWGAIFRDYRATTDYPSCSYWRELVGHYPDAKVIHSVRDPDSWFESTQATIFSRSAPALGSSPAFQAFLESLSTRTPRDVHDRALMTDYFRQHSADVEAAIPAERLLIYPVGSGWEPLCAFLGVPIPDEPYPRENDRETTAAQIREMTTISDPAAMKEFLSKRASV